jgi:hypothetical protein
MGNVDAGEGLEERFTAIMSAAQLRLSANNLEMWENHSSTIPWYVLDKLTSFTDDAGAAEWLLTRARAQDMLCVVMGYEKMLRRARRGEEAAVIRARSVLDTTDLGQAFRIFALYWFNLPSGHWISTDRVHEDLPAAQGRTYKTL